MNNKNTSLTEAEWQVMECLWRNAPVTGHDACEYLADKMGWNRSTTLTLLRRLEKKEAVKSGSEGGRKVFSPILGREDAALRETEDLLSRAYNGSVSLMVSSLTKKQSLSKREVDELCALLRELEGKNDD